MATAHNSSFLFGYPHNNQGLFSDYYLDTLLPQDTKAWGLFDNEQVRAIFDSLVALYRKFGSEKLAAMNEAGLEQHFIRPVLEILGWKDCYDVQVRETVIGPISDQPDYAFFPDAEIMLAAMPDRSAAVGTYLSKAVAVGDAKAWPVDLDARTPGVSIARQIPAVQINTYLLHSECDWGILTNGRQWRLYHRSKRRRLSEFYEIDLTRHLDDEFSADHVRYFVNFFSRRAFHPVVPGAESLLDRALAGSTGYARSIEDNLKRRAFDVVERLVNGLIAASPALAADPRASMAEVHEAALFLLYRLLFILYAEPRGLLPLAENELYRDRYSLDALKREVKAKVERGSLSLADDFSLYGNLHGLFSRIESGNAQLGVFAYNGGLFKSGRVPLLDNPRAIGDPALEEALLLLTTDEAEGSRYGDFIDYRTLDVRHLGSIYEGLLELRPDWADEEMTVIAGKNGAEYVVPSAAVAAEPKKYKPVTTGAGKNRVVKTIPAGAAWLRTDKGERKGSGTYYTPHRIVEFIVESTLGPLCAGKTREEILSLRVLDPAMGSAHFLVGAVDFLAGQLMDAPAAGPEREAVARVDDARRLVVERCIFGVDLNPLAVELAKLSLWLHTIRKDRALNFLDHHLKCGNSLVGGSVAQVSGDTATQRSIFGEKMRAALGRAIVLRRQIAHLSSDTAAQVATKTHLLEEADTVLDRFRHLFSLHTAAWFGVPGGPAALAAAAHYADAPAEEWEKATTGAEFADTRAAAARHRFFHWELEFPEAFFDADGESRPDAGFDAVIGNPPWDIVKPQSRWFFIQYDPTFWDLGKQEALRRQEELCADPAIAAAWEDYQRQHEWLSALFRDAAHFRLQFKGDLNLYKLFIERAMTLVRDGGGFGNVVPSGIYTDQGSKLLRQELLERWNWRHLYGFENRKREIFPDVDMRFKIVLLGAVKGGRTESIASRFMMQDLAELDGIEKGAVAMTAAMISRFSPDSLSIMEFNNQRDIEITAKIYDAHPLLGEQEEGTWNVKFTREFDMTNDSHLFNRKCWGAPLYEGKTINQFDPYFNSPNYWISNEHNEKYSTTYKLCFRDIARSTDARTLISAITPRVPHGNKLPVIFIEPDNQLIKLYLLGLLNSYVIDYIVRNKVSATLNFFYVMQIPIIKKAYDAVVYNIALRSGMLICLSDSYKDLWKEMVSNIKVEFVVGVEGFSQSWEMKHAVNDFTPDRRDGPVRAKLRAEIDALVAHLYGLSRDDFAYILDTFPVLKKYDEHDFGFFRSKEWALLAYDEFAAKAAAWRAEGGDGR